MSAQSMVEVADRKSRQRAVLFGFAAAVFLLVQILTHPVFDNPEYGVGWRLYAWPVNVGLLLLLLAGGGGFMNNPRLRALIQDEVAQANQRLACCVGFWVAMIVAMGLFLVPSFRTLTGPQHGYLVVTAATTAAMLTYSWREYRAHADA